MVAVDVQPYFKPNEKMVEKINKIAAKTPTAATVFSHNEPKVPFHRILGGPGPKGENTLVKTERIFNHSGYILPKELLMWLREERPEEVIVCGGFDDERVLAAGFSLFEAGLKPVLVPELCYDNDWFQHTVTIRLWEKAIGKVYESIVELDAQ